MFLINLAVDFIKDCSFQITKFWMNDLKIWNTSLELKYFTFKTCISQANGMLSKLLTWCSIVCNNYDWSVHEGSMFCFAHELNWGLKKASILNQIKVLKTSCFE